MKYDEFAFFNQQLAAMLREGVPLEGALRQLCVEMQRGQLRTELQQLETDLKNGTPLGAALGARKLPEFYVHMLQVGVRGNDLPGVLLMLADYYQRVDSIWTRLKGLMIYPLLVLIAAFALSCFFSIFCLRAYTSNAAALTGQAIPPGILAALWVPPILIGLLLGAFLLFMLVPSINRHLRWRLPAFKEAKLSQVAFAIRVMLKNGGNLGDAISLVQQMEQGTPAGRELAVWKIRLAAGQGKLTQMAAHGRAFPPLFVWLVANAGDDLAAGFQRAAEIYAARATYRIEMLLYAALPFSILALGLMVITQVTPMVISLTQFMNSLSSVD